MAEAFNACSQLGTTSSCQSESLGVRFLGTLSVVYRFDTSGQKFQRNCLEGLLDELAGIAITIAFLGLGDGLDDVNEGFIWKAFDPLPGFRRTGAVVEGG